MKEDTAERDRAVGRSLPIHLWPSADRSAWQEACRPSVRLKRGGAASHMRNVTQNMLTQRAGYFFDFLSRSGRLDMNAAAGAQVTPENVEAYVAELKGRVRSVTVYGSIQKLRRFVQLIAPDRDLGWLIDIERQLFSEMRPRSKWDRVVYTDVLEEAGLTLMAEAEMSKRPKLTRARMFRNGLMITLLAHCPIRLKNFAALEIGRSFVNVDGTWWIVLTAAETKEKGETSGQSPEELTDSIGRYLEIYRPILARGNTGSNALWMAMDGKPMSNTLSGGNDHRNHPDDRGRQCQSPSFPHCRCNNVGDPRRQQTSRRPRPSASSAGPCDRGKLQSGVLHKRGQSPNCRKSAYLRQ